LPLRRFFLGRARAWSRALHNTGASPVIFGVSHESSRIQTRIARFRSEPPPAQFGPNPGIIYGGTEAPVTIALDHNALYHALKKEAFHSSILDLEIDGKAEQVLLRDFQMHAFKQLVLHADFQRVDAEQEMHVKVALHFVNAEVSPAVKLHGATISHVANELDIVPASRPARIHHR
jgi:ribosomal protein L25 (general stress protein Ctc)